VFGNKGNNTSNNTILLPQIEEVVQYSVLEIVNGFGVRIGYLSLNAKGYKYLSLTRQDMVLCLLELSE
jgi:hypothetical protein